MDRMYCPGDPTPCHRVNNIELLQILPYSCDLPSLPPPPPHISITSSSILPHLPFSIILTSLFFHFLVNSFTFSPSITTWPLPSHLPSSIIHLSQPSYLSSPMPLVPIHPFIQPSKYTFIHPFQSPRSQSAISAHIS